MLGVYHRLEACYNPGMGYSRHLESGRGVAFRKIIGASVPYIGVAVVATQCACAEPLQLDAVASPAQQNLEMHAVVDAFWMHQAVEEQTRPPLERPRSISLGYVGDTPLTNGVMRDTPMPMVYEAPMMTYEPPQQGCSCQLSNNGYVAPVTMLR
jgi:hypothetical protein